MIPPQIDPATPSPGEVEVFNRLHDDPGTADWTVLHSYDIPAHRRQVEGEIDFVVLVPSLGVLCLEIKAHRTVSRDPAGRWQLGQSRPTYRSPFRQASEAMHSLRAELARQAPALGRILFCSAVCFPRVNFDLTSPMEWHPWQAISSHQLRARPISATIQHTLRQARARVAASPTGRWFDPDAAEPTAEQCREIARTLRPSFEFFESPAARRQERDEELRRYTEEQFDALDAMVANARVLFDGAAGTGKTLLAVEAARRAALAGDRVLLCCYNRLLGSWLEREVAPFGEQVWAGTLHRFMLQATGTAPPPAPQQAYWQQALPDLALEALLDSGGGRPPFDALLVDEAQDLLHDPYLDVLDAALSGGLASGRWRLFGDLERQAIYDRGGQDPVATIQRRCPQLQRYQLTANCRNTPRIVSLVTRLASLSPGYRRIRRPDNRIEPEFLRYTTSADQASQLAKALAGLLQSGFEPSEIVVLSRRSAQPCAEAIGPGALPVPLLPAAQPRPSLDAGSGGIAYCSIHAFKGLEAPAIVVTDISSITSAADQALLYVATTRATEHLTLLVDQQHAHELAAVLARPASQEHGS